MKKFLIVFLLLSGCASAPRDIPQEVSRDVILKKDNRVILDSKLTEPCPSLSKLTVKNYNQQEVIEILNLWIRNYKLCKKRHALLADWAIKAANSYKEIK